MEETKIYFCGSIRGGRQDRLVYEELITYLQGFGRVLTEHIAFPDALTNFEAGVSDENIHKQDMAWLSESNIVVAEVTVPSTGVGYEIGRAVEQKKPILALFRRPEAEKNVSAMVSGCPLLTYKEYETLEQGKAYIKEFLASLNVTPRQNE